MFANHAHVSAVIVVGRGIQAPSLRRTCSVLGRRRETDSLPNDATFAPALIPCRPAMSPASKKQHQYVCAHRNRVYVGIHTESLPQRTPHRLARTAVINHTNLRGATWWHEIQRNEPTRKHWFACAHTLHLRDVVLRRACSHIYYQSFLRFTQHDTMPHTSTHKVYRLTIICMPSFTERTPMMDAISSV